MINLDYSATTPPSAEVLQRFVEVSTQYIGNVNSVHALGQQASELQTEISGHIAEMLGILPGEMIYTSGASESNNLAIKGIARSMRFRGRHILTTPLEHSSVSAPLTYLQEQGYEVEMLDIDRNGKVSLESLQSLIRDDTILVTVSAVDSELGTVQPLQEIRQIVDQHPSCLLHIDASQAMGKIPFDFSLADTAAIAPHKFYGLNGSGLLYKKEKLIIEPLIHGGKSTTIYRSGSPTLALNASLETALDSALKNMDGHYKKVSAMNTFLREKLSAYPKVTINSPNDAVPYVLNLSVEGVKSSLFRDTLSQHGVCISVKSACSVDSLPSRAVFAVSRNRNTARSSWRISLSHLTTQDELNEFIKIFDQCYKELTQ